VVYILKIHYLGSDGKQRRELYSKMMKFSIVLSDRIKKTPAGRRVRPGGEWIRKEGACHFLASLIWDFLVPLCISLSVMMSSHPAMARVCGLRLPVMVFIVRGAPICLTKE